MVRAKTFHPFEQSDVFEQTEVYSTFDVYCSSKAAQKDKLSQLKLSVITQFFPPDYAATGQLIEDLIRYLGHQGLDIKVFSGQPGYAYRNATAPRFEESLSVKIVRSRTTKLWGNRVRGKALKGLLFAARTMLHLLRNCRRRNLVLVTTAPPFLPVLGYLANILLGMPYVCLLYDLYPDIAIELGLMPRQHWLARCWQGLNRRIWKRSQGLIVLSPAMKQRIVDLCPEVADKTHVIHSWAEHQKIKPMPKSSNWFARQYGIDEKFTVLYSGNMGRCHDIDTIFDAAMQLRNEPVQFVCIGGGAKRETLMERVKQAGLDSFVFLPYQEKAVLPYSLTACDVSLVSVSPGMENLVAPSKLYSALASGRAIAAICPPQTYLRQMLEEGNCGAYFDNGDSQGLAEFILSLARNPELSQAMGRAARSYMEANFTLDVIAGQYSDVLHGRSLQKSVDKEVQLHHSNKQPINMQPKDKVA